MGSCINPGGFQARPCFAHHSTAHVQTWPIPPRSLETVKRFEWTNPHAYIYLEVKDESGNTTEWAVEMMSLNHLKVLRLVAEHGSTWRSNHLHPGGAAKKRRPRHA